ncbi:hypothetical protein [Collimonas humicola]|uniref:hypothetical protein n=1 Tax=Collimonas humicola TaxID=2825886 RepID=UPI001B8C2480|nr:hypothetical protein [Collimonas humicola]
MFKEEEIEILPYRKGGSYRLENGVFVAAPEAGNGTIHLPTQEEHGIYKIRAGDVDFDIELESSKGSVYPELVEVAKDVLYQIVEMDSAARSVPTNFDYDEHLAYIRISRSEVELHYFATIANTEWGAYFVRDAHGKFQFELLG